MDESPSPEDKLITEQHLAKLLRDIKKLKPHYQEVINLRYFQELSYKEISNKLNEPMSNVKVKLLRAKKLLAEIRRDRNWLEPRYVLSYSPTSENGGLIAAVLQ